MSQAYLEGFNAKCAQYDVDPVKLAEFFQKESNLLHDAGDLAAGAGDKLTEVGDNVKEQITDIMGAGSGLLENVKNEAKDQYTGAKRKVEDIGTSLERTGEDIGTGVGRFTDRFGSRTQALMSKLKALMGMDDAPEEEDVTIDEQGQA